MFTKMPTSGKLSASNIRLPTYIDATKPQKMLGCSFTNVGPGGTPWIISAAISTAGVGPGGRPGASIRAQAPGQAALVADSGPAGPAPAPFPNSPAALGARRRIASDRERAKVGAR